MLIEIILFFVSTLSYIPYIIDTIKKKTRPHIFTWFIWTIVLGVVIIAQIQDNIGFGVIASLCSGIMTGIIMMLAIFYYGDKKANLIDWFFFILGLIAILVWILTNNPLYSVIIVSFIEICAFVPTFKKCYYDPHSETLSMYYIGIFKYLLSFTIFDNFSIITMLFPMTVIIANIFLLIFVYIRKKQIRKH